MSKPRRAHGAERCTVRNPGPHGARCRYQAGHDPVDDGVNGHAPELDDVTKADGSPVDFAPVGPIELRAALREERSARLKAEAERDDALARTLTAQAEADKFQGWEETARMEAREALALLSKAREAWAACLALDATSQSHARECWAWDTDMETYDSGECDCPRAELAKILGTGETT